MAYGEYIGFHLCEKYRQATFGSTNTELVEFNVCTLPSDIKLTANDFGYNDGEFVIYDGNSITFQSEYCSYPNMVYPAMTFSECELDNGTIPVLFTNQNNQPAFVFTFDRKGVPLETQAIGPTADQILQKMVKDMNIYCHFLDIPNRHHQIIEWTSNGYNKYRLDDGGGINRFEDYRVATLPSLIEYSQYSVPEKCTIIPGTSTDPLHFTIQSQTTLPNDIKQIDSIGFFDNNKDLIYLSFLSFSNAKKDDVLMIKSRVELVYETGVMII